MVARSHGNYFRSTFSRVNSSRKVIHTDRVSDMLKLLKTTKEDNRLGERGKIVKKSDRNHLK